MNITIELLKLLGSPFVKTTSSIYEKGIMAELSRYSRNNRILLYYLETIIKSNLDHFYILYQEENSHYLASLDAIARASKALADIGIEHAVFKTIRPYRSATADIDILIFGEKNNYIKAINEMQKVGNKLVVYGPRSTTLWDPKANIGIDLYEQVATSFIIYIDKQTLAPHLTTTMLENGNYVKTLKCEADLLCIIAHSIIKEQMYTLSEFYTFVHYLKRLELENFLSLVEQNNLSQAARTHTTITALLHKVAFGIVPRELRELQNSLGENKFEASRMIQKEFETPYKYHPITLARSLIEIAKAEKARESLATQLYHMLNLKFSKDFVSKMINHILRETY